MTQGQKEKGAAEGEMVRELHQVNGLDLSKLQDIAEDRGTWCAAVHAVTKSWT